ncbi:hypothetical protein CXB51_010833 [Gossypium anomalum]|uniref:Uncharacterized protein n=1 Tax=Gossypium anomalum TaxID=47600 RepID=A0A8J5Z383_9ROSI|nr:hypothetical protein CXB51_010833 [Gossypium anomalum]
MGSSEGASMPTNGGRCYARRALSALFWIGSKTEPPQPAATQEKGGTLRFFALHRGQWSNPQGFDDLQIGEKTPERTQLVNRRCCATRGRGGVWYDETARVVALLVGSGG